MIKKILVSCICFISLVGLAGCADRGDTKSLTTLNNQLSRVESIVSSTSMSEVEAVSPYVTLDENEPFNSIQSFRALSNENMNKEEDLRQEILSMTQCLKSCTNKKYKLGTKKSNALKDISNNLSKYSSHLNETKSQVKSSVNKIKKYLKVNSINIEEATSSYITLNNSMNERYAYLCNIYDNLEEACIILECNCCNSSENSEIEFENTPYVEDDENFEESNTQEKINAQKSENIEEENENKIINNTTGKKENSTPIKNIDTYNPFKNQNTENQNIQQGNATIDTTNPVAPPQNVTETPYPPFPPNHNHAYNHYPNQYNFGYNGFNNYYGNRINPNRNTDTYYSFNRNIDTYRFNPNYYYNYTY